MFQLHETDCVPISNPKDNSMQCMQSKRQSNRQLPGQFNSYGKKTTVAGFERIALDTNIIITQ